MTAQNEMAWSGFQEGETAEKSLDAGTYPAYLRGDIREIGTMHGIALKLYYNVFVQGRSGLRKYEMSELATPVYTTGSKFVRRLAAANNRQISDDTDLSQLKTEGWVLVTLERDRDGRYLNIKDVVPVPRGFNLPTVADPATPPEKAPF